MVQVQRNLTPDKRPIGQIGKIRRESSARRIGLLIFVEARSRRVVECEVSENDGGNETEEVENFHGKLITKILRRKVG